METQTKRGNPNFGKKKVSAETEDLNKQYIFQLIQTHEKQKPISAKQGDLTGEIHSPYQPFYGIVNSGLAWDKEFTPKNGTKPGASRRWRYLYGFPTIWVDEQIDPEPTKEDLASNLNDLTFRNGVLRIFGYETTKLKALELNDAYEGNERPLKNIPKQYRLLNQDKIDKHTLELLDLAFEAEKNARECSLEEMYICAYYFGIDLNKGDDHIRKEFIGKARNNPSVFNREMVNPKNKYTYIFNWGLSENIISGTMQPGCLLLVDTQVKVYDLKTDDIATEMAQATFLGDKEAEKVYAKLEQMWKNA